MDGGVRYWLDCEFNDFQGELISMALVCEDGREWYEVLECKTPSKWVAENVMPVLGKPPTSRAAMQKGLSEFLSVYDSATIISDWPEDIKHFCELLIRGPGQRIHTPVLWLCINRELDSKSSAIPHNALADARAIRG